jgi:hypothetical protein
MIRWAAVAGFLVAVSAAAAQTFVVPPALWDRPRSGSALLGESTVRQAVLAGLAQPGARLVVRHDAGQESLIVAEELRSWLVALAIEPARIWLRADLPPGEPLQILVTRD